MEPSLPCTLQVGQPIQTFEEIELLLSRGMYQPTDTLIEGHPYALVLLHRRFHDIFVVLKHNFIREIRLFLLQQKCCTSVRRLLVMLFSNNVDEFYLEYEGTTDTGNPFSGHMADGLTCIYRESSRRPCVCVKN
jgi:hypothetical protein